MKMPLGYWMYGIGSLASLLAIPVVDILPRHSGPGVPDAHRRIGTSRYMPHQGAREKARRVRQMQRPV